MKASGSKEHVHGVGLPLAQKLQELAKAHELDIRILIETSILLETGNGCRHLFRVQLISLLKENAFGIRNIYDLVIPVTFGDVTPV